MIEPLKRLFTTPESAPAEPTSVEAAAALLAQVAHADDAYTPAEHAVMRTVLQEAFGLEPNAADAAASKGEALAEEATDHHRFTRISKSLPLEQRVALVEGLWRIIVTDGDECPFEDAMARRLADLLHVPPREARLARQRALGHDDGTQE